MNTVGANTLYRTVLNTDGTNTFIQGFLCVREKVQAAADETPREISLLTPLTDISAAPVTLSPVFSEFSLQTSLWIWNFKSCLVLDDGVLKSFRRLLKNKLSLSSWGVLALLLTASKAVSILSSNCVLVCALFLLCECPVCPWTLDWLDCPVWTWRLLACARALTHITGSYSIF